MLHFLDRGTSLARNLTYFMVCISYGMYHIALGPLIPYLAQSAHKVETEYAYLFACRAAGMLTGAILFNHYQSLPSRFTYHQILALSFIAIIAFNFFFLQSQSQFFQGFWSFMMAIPFFLLEIAVDLSIMALRKHVDELILITSACFSVGAFIAPILLRVLGVDAYLVFAVVLGACIPIIWYLPSPEVGNQQQTKCLQQSQQNINHKSENLLSIISFIYLGLLVTKLALSPSYAVMAINHTKQSATFFPSLYSIFNIITKFVWIFVPIKGSKRLRIVAKMMVCVSVLSLLMKGLGLRDSSLSFDCIGMAIFMSPLSALIISVSNEYQKPLTSKQASKIATWGVIGQGVLTMICGKLMDLDVNAYFYFSIVMCLTLAVATYYVLAELEKKNEIMDLDIMNPENQIELTMLEKGKRVKRVDTQQTALA